MIHTIQDLFLLKAVLLTISDFKFILIVDVVNILAFRSQVDSSTINPIVDAEPRLNIRSPQRGNLFVLASKRFEIKI